MKPILFLSILAFAFSACCKAIIEDVTIIQNDSQQTVNLTAYYAPTTASNSPASLAIGPGKSADLMFPAGYAGVDSIIVQFDGQHKSVHHSKALSNNNTASGAIFFSSSRSLLNADNYVITIKSLSCNGSSRRSTFKITEQDYIDSED